MSNDLSGTLDQLRREYLAEAPARLADLRADVEGIRHEHPGALASLRTRFHRLAGSGGSYGFPEISALAREVEVRLTGDEPPQPDALDDAVDRLAVLFGEAEALLGRGDEVAPLVAVVAAPAGVGADRIAAVLAEAGFEVSVAPPPAGPESITAGRSAQIIVVAFGSAGFDGAALAPWARDRPAGQTLVAVLPEPGTDRLAAVAAGSDVAVGARQVPTQLARLAERVARNAVVPLSALVADGNEPRAARLVAALRDEGLEAHVVHGAAAAQDHLLCGMPDVVIVHAGLPGGGGLLLTRLLRGDRRGTLLPVIVTGVVGEAARREVLDAGGDEAWGGGDDGAALARRGRERARRWREVRELLTRDPATGLLTGPAFRAELAHAVACAVRTRSPLAVIAIRLAGSAGFAAADDLMAHTARAVRHTVRAGDLVGRTGRFNIGVGLPVGNPAARELVIGKLRAALMERPFEARDGLTIPLRAELGGAGLGPDGTDGDQLLEAAERRLA